jgi:hypothetical protein
MNQTGVSVLFATVLAGTALRADTIATYPPGTILENIAIAPAGDLFVSDLGSGALYRISPQDASQVFGRLVWKVDLRARSASPWLTSSLLVPPLGGSPIAPNGSSSLAEPHTSPSPARQRYCASPFCPTAQLARLKFTRPLCKWTTSPLARMGASSPPLKANSSFACTQMDSAPGRPLSRSAMRPSLSGEPGVLPESQVHGGWGSGSHGLGF